MPEDYYFADDAPRELAQLLEALVGYRVLVLGDFIESLTLSQAALADLPRARRLRQIFQLLRACSSARVILGNHDARAKAALRRALPGQVVETSLLDGAVRFLHGHTCVSTDPSHFASVLHGVAIPLGVTLRRLGLDVDLGPKNREIARRVPAGEYWCFGHTHEPAVTLRYANSGSFLRKGWKTVLTFEAASVRLWGKRAR